MLYTVIMAGGKGTRFWPSSRESMPKQLLKIVGERTMIQATVDRIKSVAPPSSVIVITGAGHEKQVRRQLPEIPVENIIAEPIGRNTAPCVALSAMIVKERDPDGVIAVLPADHVITKPDKLRETVDKILARLSASPDRLATIGIKPSYPETGYGYIKRGAGISESIFEVGKFLEKPDAKTAKEYVDSGEYYWNSGMFFWRAETVLDLMRAYMPELMNAMERISKHVGRADFPEIFNEAYPSVPSESIDYGLMEKAAADGKVIVAEADPGWSDVGSWRSLCDLETPDKDGNFGKGRFIAVDSKGVFAHNDKRMIAAIGLKDIVIIETDDAVLVCHKDKAQDVRRVIELLKEKGYDDLL
ncbi:Mannose-1-phosphate guanylyltransferase [hydrothermal vent metagenome]|uniref:Mannose-1-phosphate guanylyltransferase n=1 Tax=hydrothermal vent metagenome TaxID=652676 RepID=A0A3B1D0K4_9ZZZZ